MPRSIGPVDLMRAAIARRAAGDRPRSPDDSVSPDTAAQPAVAPPRVDAAHTRPTSQPRRESPPVAPASLAAPDDLEPVGRVADSYGVDGRLKVQPFGSIEDSVLLTCDQWWVRAAPVLPPSRQGAATSRRAARASPAASRSEPSRPAAGDPVAWRVERARVHGALILARIAGLRDREAALRWRGAEVLVSRARFPAPSDDEYYWVDLVGCAVFNREGAALGQVTAIDDHGAHALLRIQPPEGRAFLMPFVEAYVDRVDLAGRRIEVDWQPDYL